MDTKLGKKNVGISKYDLTKKKEKVFECVMFKGGH